MEQFSHIYIEKTLMGAPRTEEILRHFPNARRIYIDHYKDVFNRHGQNIALQHRYPNLILAKKQGNLVYPGAPVCQNFGNSHFFYTSCSMNCLFDCEYCYLKGMYPSGNLVLFLNIEDIFEEVEKLLKKHPVYLCVSYDTDLLAMEELLHYGELWAGFLKNRPGLSIEIRTKSGSLSYWKRMKEILRGESQERMIFAFTISPEFVIREYEHRTGSLAARLKSIRAGLALGFPVRLCFDPMICCPEWREQYDAMLLEVFRQIPMEQIRDVSVGSFRLSESYLKNMRKAMPASPVVQFPYENDHGVYHYSKALTEEMEEFLVERIQEKVDKDHIFRWES